LSRLFFLWGRMNFHDVFEIRMLGGCLSNGLNYQCLKDFGVLFG
jgi:hypothetical protein